MRPSRAVATDMTGTALRRRGWRWAHARAGWSAALAALACGCLVTDQAEFGEPNIPSTLEPLQPTSLARVPPDPNEECFPSSERIDDRTPADLTDWMVFAVKVTDANIEDQLEARLVVNGQDVNAKEIAKTGKAYRGELRLCAKLRTLSEACNRVEMLVSSDFHVEGRPYRTRQEGDLARWEWSVFGLASDFPEIYPSDCVPDGGT